LFDSYQNIQEWIPQYVNDLILWIDIECEIEREREKKKKKKKKEDEVEKEGA